MIPPIVVPNARITHTAYKRLIAVCRQHYPYEACGILAGEAQFGNLPFANVVLSIRNQSATPKTSFRFQPDEWVQTYFNMQKNQQKLVGFFHSHPCTEAQPSPKDIGGWPAEPDAYYWIVSL